MPIFNIRKSPSDIIKALKESLHVLDKEESQKKLEKANEEFIKQINNLKTILFSHPDSEIPSENVIVLCTEILNNNIVSLVLDRLHKIDFETKKEFVLILGNLLRKQLITRDEFIEHILNQKTIIPNLIQKYSNPELSLIIGMILREFAKYPQMCERILYSQEFNYFFDLINNKSFDVSSDAYLTFKELLTRHKKIVAIFLEAEYKSFFTSYNKLILSENYVTKRQSIKLLGELLVERDNSKILVTYVSSIENLKLIMTLLKDKSSNVQYEAFHVFKTFVVNPSRSSAVTEILLRNQSLLVEYLSTFHDERKDDEQFIDERDYVIHQIQVLGKSPPTHE